MAEQIRDEVKTFILAGHETTASMLTWTLYELSQHPECLAKVREEAARLFGPLEHKTEDGRAVIDRMPSKTECEVLVYTECCLRESLRKYSVVPTLVRMADEDVDVGPYHLPKGTTVMINVQGVHHNPEYWPEPLVYRPERFLSEIAPYTFIPFIEGPRMCMGQYLSVLEAKVMLSLLVHKVTFESVNEDAGEKHPFMVPIIPKTGHFMKIH